MQGLGRTLKGSGLSVKQYGSPIAPQVWQQRQCRPSHVQEAQSTGVNRQAGWKRSRTVQVYATAAAITPAEAAKAAGKAPPPANEEVDASVDVFPEIVPGVCLLRCGTAARLKYEVEYGSKRGSSDNCYLMCTGQGGPVVLVDVPFEAYAAKFVDTLAGQLPGGLQTLTHLIITHLDPKCMSSLELLVARWLAAGGQPGALCVTLSNPALRLLQASMGAEKAPLLTALRLVVARSGMDVLAGMPQQAASTGSSTAAGACSMQLYLVPTPRWPDLLVAYLPGQQALISSKLFSAHALPGVVPGTQASSASDAGAGWEAYSEEWRYYYDCMLAPVARQAQAGLERLALVPVQAPRVVRTNKTSAYFKGLMSQLGAKLGMAPITNTAATTAPSTASSADSTGMPESLPVCCLLPLHGPVVSSAVQELVTGYVRWTGEQVAAAATSCVAVLYASAYGNTASLAQAISRGITKGGVAVNTVNLEVAGADEVAAAIKEADGFVIGSPTLGGHMPTQVAVTLGALMRAPGAKELPCGVFGSFGWSGEAVDEMEGKLKDAGFGFAFDSVRVKFKPGAKELALCEESGRALAQSVKRRLKAKEVSAAPSKVFAANTAQLAAGRLVGSLSVLTAKGDDGSDYTAAMLASWVSQASFTPPGLSVSVKKDRAMEPLMVVGGKFALSTVGAGKDKEVMKRLARPFSPGEDRLSGLETTPSPGLGLPVLGAANAWMECQVVSRMEAGDHYVIYAQVLAGAVVDDSTPTAVHYRKVANHY